MKRNMGAVEVYLEVGKKRVFASAIDWPGWCRSGPDEAAALNALVDYSRRYASAVGIVTGPFVTAAQRSDLHVVERLPGDATTDFGAPHIAASNDSRPLKAAELDRLVQLLGACWQAFDAASKAAASTRLAAGPRGGGRDVAGMRAHVLGAEAAYLGGLGGRFIGGAGVDADLDIVRRAFLDAAGAKARGELPERGPRGGLRWSPRYAIRRSAWHSLDHAWEIADRST